MIDIGIFGAGVALLNFAQTILIDASKHSLEWQPKDRALRSAPCASMAFSTHELAEFPR
jgi:hypothetical protein